MHGYYANATVPETAPPVRQTPFRATLTRIEEEPCKWKDWQPPAFNAREKKAELRKQSKYREGGKYGNWRTGNRRDGILKAGFKFYDALVGSSDEKENVLSFNMASLGTASFEADFDGPLLDDSATYSGIGMHELNLIKNIACPEWNGTPE